MRAGAWDGCCLLPGRAIPPDTSKRAVGTSGATARRRYRNAAASTMPQSISASDRPTARAAPRRGRVLESMRSLPSSKSGPRLDRIARDLPKGDPRP
jgi:hypothetical protein